MNSDSGAQTRPDPQPKYWAFISYSHRDEYWATWLHRSLERYRVHRALVGRAGPAGVTPKRFLPIFRDRDELPGGADLTHLVNEALSQSRFLIVICSPHSAASRYVNEEIATFKRMRRSDMILCLVVDGEPGASANPESGSLEALPEAVRHDLEGAPLEPLAADARADKDGKADAFLKVVSGLLGVGFDDLKQRETRRRRWRRVQFATIVSTMAVLIAGVWWNEHQKTLSQMARSDWEIARRELADGKNTLALHYYARALKDVPGRHQFKEMLQEDIPEQLISMGLESMVQHQEAVNGAVFDRAEERLLTWSDDGTARLWNAETSEPIGQAMLHNRRVTGAAFDQSEDRILTWSEDGTARLWNAETGGPIGDMVHEQSIRELEPYVAVYSAVFVQSEECILTWSQDGTARLWNAETGDPIKVMRHGRLISGAVFDHAAKRILTWDENGQARLWNAETGDPIGLGGDYGGSFKGAVFDHAGARILTWSGILDWSDGSYRGSTAQLFDAKTGDPIGHAIEHGRLIEGAMFDRSGERILAWGGSTAWLWNADKGATIGRNLEHEDTVEGAVFDRTSHRILTWSQDGTARLWNAETGDPIGEAMVHNGRVSGALFDQSEERILTWSDDSSARLWNAETGDPIGKTTVHGGSVSGALFGQSGEHILTWSDDGATRLWKLQIGDPIGEVMVHNGRVSGALFDQSEERILTWSDDSSARLWNAETGDPIGEAMVHNGRVSGAFFDQSEQRILTWSDDGTVRLWNAETGDPIVAMVHQYSDRGHEFLIPVKRAFLHKSGERILTVFGYSARFWNVETGEPIGKDIEHGDTIRGVAFDRAEARILTWSLDGSARLWNAETGDPIGHAMKHGKAWISGAVFNHTEQRILTWSQDGTARLWNAETGDPIGQAIVHEGSNDGKRFVGRVDGAAFDQAGERVLTWGSVPPAARLWNAETGEPIGEAMVHGVPVRGGVFDRNGEFTLTWSKAGTAWLWNAETGQPIKAIAHGGPVAGAVFQRTGERILTWGSKGSNPATARLWNAETGDPIGHAMKHGKAWISGAVFNHTEQRILTWSDGRHGTARLWNAKTGDPIGQVMEYGGSPLGLVFGQSSRRILAWSSDTVRLWYLPGDLDFPKKMYGLEIEAMTGTRLDVNKGQLSFIPAEEWRDIRSEWLEFARKHARTCKYPRQNTYLRFWEKDKELETISSAR